MPRVIVAGGESEPFTGATRQFEVAASTVGRMIAELEGRYPGFGDYISRRMAVVIDGEIHQDAHGTPLPEHAEIYLIPKIGGG